MAGRLVNALGCSALAAEAFSDLATLRHMLRFEAALAQAAAEAGLIPKKFAPVIVKACDPRALRSRVAGRGGAPHATLTVPVVKALADEVAKRDADAAGYVHWGATSQDVIDTAMVLQLAKRCRRS
jgi:3-carboxy-cis,cis-muconate cycloisomerase